MTNNASDIFNQIFNLLNKSKRILLLTHARADADGLGSMISMYLALKEIGKEATAVTADPTPESLGFLPAMNMVQTSLASAKDFIITLDCNRTPVNKIKYNLEDKRVNIIISPKHGSFSEKDVSFGQGSEDRYDLIMTFDTGNLEHLGVLYDQNAEMFYKTPVINVDHHSSNTDFGQVNLVDVMFAATTEVVFGLLKAMEKQYNKKLITSDIATLLLAGLITDTGSFQHSNTSPQAMETAAELMDLGARQQEIIKNIYKTKKLSTLKLWGIALSKVQVDPVYRMVWSVISQTDLREAGATSEETGSIIDDLLSNAPGAEVILLIKHNDDGVISVSMRSTTNSVDVGSLCANLGGGGHVRAAGFKVKNGRSFDQVVTDTVTRVREFQAKRLNIHPEDLEGARQAAVANQSNPKLPLQETKSGAPKTGKETVLEFKVKPEAPRAPASNAPTAAPAMTTRPAAPALTNAPAAGEGKEHKRKRGKEGGGGNPGPNVTGSAPAVKPEASKPVVPKAAIPQPMPKPVSVVTPVSTTPPATPVVPVPAPVAPPTPTAPTPSAPPAPPASSKPTPKTDSSPDVPDWLKAE